MTGQFQVEMLSLFVFCVLCAVASGDDCFGGGLLGSLGATPKCYHFIMSTQPYEEAAAICGNIGGTLVSIANQLEEAFIISNSHKKLAVTDYWIGLTNLFDGAWRWDDQSTYNYTSNWATDAPKDDASKNCVTGRLNTGKWFNVDCTENRNFVCQTQPLNFAAENVPTKHCTTFTSDGLSFDKCYLSIDSEQTYEEAEILCENFEALLVSLANNAEALLVAGAAKAFLPRKNYWIGMDRLFDGVNWQWSDGDTYDMKNFSNWAPGFPTNKSRDDCVMALSVNSKWENKDCSSQMSFVCEVKPTVVPASETPSPPPATCPASPTCSATANCSDPVFDRNWVYFPTTQSLYYVIGNVQVTVNWFDEYEAKCVAMGAHLPSIHSSIEYNFVSGLYVTNGVAIGYRSKTNIYGFEWSDGSADDYSPWQSGDEPTADRLCAYIYRYYSGFIAISCTASTDLVMVCKKPYA